jgi:hypothetical protein
MKRRTNVSAFCVSTLAFIAALASGCAASSTEVHAPLLAQHHGSGGSGGGGGQTCRIDADCHIRLPAARACPGGAQSIPSSCCRMNYCGICWSDCPPAARSTGSNSDAPLFTM